MSDEDTSLIRRPTFGSRRVSVLVGAPVIVGCALLGSIIGVTHPLRSTVADAQRGVEPTQLRRASANPIDEPRAVGQRPETEAALRSKPGLATGSTGSEVAAPARTAAVSAVGITGTAAVEQPMSPGANQDVASALGDRPKLAPPAGAAPIASPSQRHAHAKRLRRMLWRRARAKPPPGAQPGGQVDAFISSILPMKQAK